MPGIVDVKGDLGKIDTGVECADVGELDLLGRERNSAAEQLAVIGDSGAVGVVSGRRDELGAGLDQLVERLDGKGNMRCRISRRNNRCGLPAEKQAINRSLLLECTVLQIMISAIRR